MRSKTVSVSPLLITILRRRAHDPAAGEIAGTPPSRSESLRSSVATVTAPAEVRYARASGDVDIAYTVFGEGPFDVGGIGVHIGARIAAVAGRGEILVSRTVKDLVTGSGITLRDRGTHTLTGVPDEW